MWRQQHSIRMLPPSQSTPSLQPLWSKLVPCLPVSILIASHGTLLRLCTDEPGSRPQCFTTMLSALWRRAPRYGSAHNVLMF